MTAFSSAPGTFLIELDPEVRPLPIIGWAHTTGLNVSPLVLGHPGPLVSGEAFLLHTGAVYDPAVNEMFEDEDTWRETVSDYTNYRPGSVLSLFAIPATATPQAPEVPTRAQPQVKTEAPSGELIWGTKTFKSKSFWCFTPPGKDEIIFVVEGGMGVPKNAEKITRDQFYAKRKAGAVETTGVPADEPELPLPSAPDDEEDDDLI